MKRYDRAYYDRWYRRRTSRVITPDLTARRAALALSVAEVVLDRPVRSVLDVGCGEGTWGAWLRRRRPGLRYLGVDPSEYAVQRFGRRRNLRLGAFGDLRGAGVRGRFDLVICADVLQYIPTPALTAGLRELAGHLGDGIAFLPAYTSDDAMEGDFEGWHWRPPAVWRRAFRAAGLAPVGMHCWVQAARRDALNVFERADG
ncbi:MAG: class I SAM-dependent methyltransferase [Gemmatimonadaceae bacterium]|nr:class I SAM-dependent methyltransferase [Gemmatimonadaceae bacterium]